MESYITEVSASFKRGTAEMLLLRLLTKRDCYLYDLSKALKESSNGQFDIRRIFLLHRQQGYRKR